MAGCCADRILAEVNRMSAMPAEVLLDNLEGVWPEDALEFMPKERAYQELKALTGEDWGYDVEKWRACLKSRDAQAKKA